MYFRLLHFMDHRFDGMGIQFINENGIIMMNKWLNNFIHSIAKKEGFIVEVDLDIHTRHKVQGTRYKKP